jgi:hypothetical protein
MFRWVLVDDQSRMKGKATIFSRVRPERGSVESSVLGKDD